MAARFYNGFECPANGGHSCTKIGLEIAAPVELVGKGVAMGTVRECHSIQFVVAVTQARPESVTASFVCGWPAIIHFCQFEHRSCLERQHGHQCDWLQHLLWYRQPELQQQRVRWLRDLDVDFKRPGKYHLLLCGHGAQPGGTAGAAFQPGGFYRCGGDARQRD